jgi:DNA-binding transcriptional ArsR family regulator
MAPDTLSSTLAALADPTRRGILARLVTGDATVSELAEPYDMSLAAVSKHLKVLEGAGLISRTRESQWRPCHLEAKPLKAATVWLEDYRKFWDRNFDSLAAYLKTMDSHQSRPKKGRPR